MTEEQLINPDDIIFDDGEAMPVPESEDYNSTNQTKQSVEQNKTLKPTAKFLKLFEDCLGQLPYNAILTNANNEKIKLTSLFQFVEAKQAGMTVGDMNTLIGFIAPIEYKIINPIMSIIDVPERQRELWTLE